MRVHERGDGKPVVFIHGLTFDHQLLLEASESAFSDKRARRIYVDLPGHGGSPVEEGANSASGLVAALLGVVDACAEPPFIVGHSYGGYLALGIAAMRPLAGVLLVTPVIEPDVARRKLPARRALRPVELTFGAERETFEEIAVVQTAPLLAVYQRLVHPASERTDRALLDAVRARYVLPWPLAGSIDPSLRATFLCGRDDHWVGYEDVLPLVRALPHAELEVVADCGQLLPIEAPERYRAALLRSF